MSEIHSVPLHLKGLSEFVDHSIRLDRSGEEHASVIEKHLSTGSVIAPFNHRSIIDPLVVMRELSSLSGSSLRKIILPASMKFFDGRMGNTATQVMYYVAQKYGVELLPTIQHYDQSYTDDEKLANYRQVIGSILGSLKEPGTVVALSPEGTRSPTAQLLPAQKGLDLFMKRAPQSLVLPIALEGTENIVGSEYRTVHPWHRAAVSLGAPMRAEEIIEYSRQLQIQPRDAVMLHIAANLPQEDRGYYRSESFPWFYDLREMGDTS